MLSILRRADKDGARKFPRTDLDVLLVWPEMEKRAAAQTCEYTLKMTGFKAVLPPTGLCTMAAYLPSGWKLRLVDMNATRLTDEDIRRADYVMIGGIIGQERSFLEVARRANALGKKVIAGGSMMNSSHVRFGQEPAIATICVGECEPYIERLVADMEAGALKSRYGDGTRPSFEEISTRPPRYDLLGRMQRLRYFSVAIETSRGCPFNCEFCDIVSVFGRKPRYKLPHQVIADLENLKRLGWQGLIALIDDNLIGGNVEAKRVLETIADWQVKNGHPFHFTANVSIDISDRDESIELFKRAGIRYLFIGVESPNAASLEEAGKKVNLRGNLVGRLKKLIRAGFDVDYGMMVGFDHDDERIFGEIEKFIEESDVPNVLIQLVQVLDNTRLYDRLKSEGRLLKQVAGHQLAGRGRTNFKTRLDPDVLARGYAGVLERIYDHQRYYDRLRRFVLLLGEDYLDNMNFLRPQLDFTNALLLAQNALYGMDRAQVFATSLRVLAEGGSWRFWKFHQYVQTGFSYLDYYDEVAEAARKSTGGATAPAIPTDRGAATEPLVASAPS